MSRIAVYLAGGFRSGWQDLVIRDAPNLNYFDPRENNTNIDEEYTLWDLEAIRKCDIILVYLEDSNPSCYGACLELGFAHALGKRIIFIDEKSSLNSDLNRYFGMLRACANICYFKLEDAIQFLSKLPSDKNE